jgi:flagellin-like protein
MGAHGSGDEAVSPVIATVLMVAITLVLAGVLFVIVRGLGETNDVAPPMQFVRDNLNGQLTVIKSYKPIDLTQVEVQTGVDTHFGYNVPASSATRAAPAGDFVALAGSPGQVLTAGDVIDFCQDSGPGKVDVVIRILDPTPIVMYENSFTNLVGCG